MHIIQVVICRTVLEAEDINELLSQPISPIILVFLTPSNGI